MPCKAPGPWGSMELGILDCNGLLACLLACTISVLTWSVRSRVPTCCAPFFLSESSGSEAEMAWFGETQESRMRSLPTICATQKHHRIGGKLGHLQGSAGKKTRDRHRSLTQTCDVGFTSPRAVRTAGVFLASLGCLFTGSLGFMVAKYQHPCTTLVATYYTCCHLLHLPVACWAL